VRPRTVIVVGLAALSFAASCASPAVAASKKSNTVWLCKPGLAKNPCASDLTATVNDGGGSTRVELPTPTTRKIDCFYVYPTVSGQFRPAATLRIDPEVREEAIQQAARFSTVCRVFAPMYRQLTVASLIGTKPASAKDRARAYADVRAAWRDYLARYNKGRGVVLLGHSQGTFHLTDLIAKEIDSRPAVRKRLVSAILLGGNVQVAVGKEVGGDFKNVAACRSNTQIGCVVAYSAFSKPPNSSSLFGRSTGSGREALCVNPAALAGGTALVPYFHNKAIPGPLAPFTKPPASSTPWVSYPTLYTAHCEKAGGLNWLQVDDVGAPGDGRMRVTQPLGPLWGLHLVDFNIALGNLVQLVSIQAITYLKP